MNKRSLPAKTVRITVTGSLLLGIIALLIGLAVYVSTMVRQYVRHAFETASHARLSATHGADSVTLAKQVMEIYRSLTPEQRALKQTDPEAYRALFSSIDTEVGKGGTWDVLINLLDTFVIDVDDVYLGMYDEQTNALVYVANADDEIVMYPGDWETVSEKEVQKFLNWDGTGMLYEISHTKEYGWLCTAGYPIKDRATGEVCEFLLVDVSVDNVIRGVKDFTVTVSLGMLVITGIMAWLIRRRIKKTVADPIDAITNAAVAYVKGKKDGAEGSYFSELRINTGDELENLSHVMADMEKELGEVEQDLVRATAEKERISTELSMATKIQEGMLPDRFPAFPDRPEFDIFAAMDPAREVGGDFYDFFLVDDDHLCVVMADVSGKGIPAALFMMAAKIILQNNAMMGKTPVQILTDTNAVIFANNKMELFVTVWLGILEISTGKLTYADGGHLKPLLYQDGRWRFVDKNGGVVLGMLSPEELEGISEKYRIRDQEILLSPGDVLFQYTDGVTEAINAGMEQFGEERFLSALDRAPSVDPDVLLPHVRAELNAFVKDAEQFDDITMLALRYNGGR